MASQGHESFARSSSKRHFLKLMLLAGGAATLALASPRTVNASSVGNAPSPNPSRDKANLPTLKLSRVYRFNDPKTGAPQISDFPDADPAGDISLSAKDNSLEVRMKHFTEIENFTFLGYVLAHELGGTVPKPISTLAGLQVPDHEFQSLINLAQTDNLTDEDLGDTTLDLGINWEHFVASTNDLRLDDHPLKITDLAIQAKIDSLDLITEALVSEINKRSIEKRRDSGERGRHKNS